MSQTFVKGRTDNHLTWVMVDATDFATPESALSAAMKIKIYGKVRADNTVYFVSSGTGSLTNDIKHVGASALGIYTIGLVKADLSDASNAWYDQYIVSLSATGAAYQTLVVDGGIDASALSKLQSTLSDMQSYLAVMSGVQSDLYSLLSDHHSDFQSRVPKAVATNSQLSDLHSDLRSFLVVMSGVESDIYSALLAPGASFTSDIASAVWAHAVGTRVDSRLLLTQSMASDAASAAQQGNSRILLTQSLASDAHSAATQANSRILAMSGVLSDTYSLLSDFESNFGSRVPKLVATNSQVSDLSSDIKSAVQNITVTIGASDISDIASAVVAALPITSAVSDIYSLLSSFESDFQSRIPKEPAARSQLSDLASDLASDLKSFIGAGVPVDASSMSDLRSAVLSLSAAISDAHSAAAQANSRALLLQSDTSDIYSLLSDLHSDVGVMSGVTSDIYSRLQAGIPMQASDISDLRSAIVANGVLRNGAEPGGVPGHTAPMANKVDWLYTLGANRIEQTTTLQRVRDEAEAANIASATVADDGLSFIRGSFS